MGIAIAALNPSYGMCRGALSRFREDGFSAAIPIKPGCGSGHLKLF